MTEATESMEGTDEVQGTESQEATDSFDRDYVEGLRKENAKWRTQTRSLEKQIEDLTGKINEFEDAKKSDLERLTDEKTRLEKALEEKEQAVQVGAVETAVKLAAQQMGLRDPDACYRLVDLSSIDYNEGDVKGADKALQKLLKEKPYLKNEDNPPPTPGAGGPAIQGSEGFEQTILGALKGTR